MDLQERRNNIRKKRKNGFYNFILITFSALLVVVVISAGVTEYQPYVKAQEKQQALKIEEDAKLLTEYIEKLENHFKDYQKVSAITELDMKKIRIMESYLLEKGGMDGKLQGRANDFMNVCKFSEINLDPMLLWSIAIQETSAGHSLAIKNLNNVGGIFNGNKLREYRSIYRSIVDMALNIKYSGHYDNVEGLFNNKTTQTTINQLGNIYCPVGASNDPTGLNKHWIPAVSKNYNAMFKMYNNQI